MITKHLFQKSAGDFWGVFTFLTQAFLLPSFLFVLLLVWNADMIPDFCSHVTDQSYSTRLPLVANQNVRVSIFSWTYFHPK